MSESIQNDDSVSERIAIVGMAWAEAESPDLASFWSTVTKGSSCRLSEPIVTLPSGLRDKAIADALLDAGVDPLAVDGREVRILAIEDCPSASVAFERAFGYLDDSHCEAVIVNARINHMAISQSNMEGGLPTKEGGMAVVLARFSEALAKGVRIYACFEAQSAFQEREPDLSETNAEDDLSRGTGDCIYATCEPDQPTGVLAGVIKSALALYHRTIPPGVSVGHISRGRAANYRELFFNSQARPWIHPSAHPELMAIKPEAAALHQPRQAFVVESPHVGKSSRIVLEEAVDDYFAVHPTLYRECETEVFTFASENTDSLIIALSDLKRFLLSHSGIAIRDIAYTLNCHKVNEAEIKLKHVRIAIVAGTIEDLIERVDLTIENLQTRISYVAGANLIDRGIYIGGDTAQMGSGKLAFLLPGLGSAYPNMLSELCIHFPEVRTIFDFVDYLAQDAGSAELPSDKIFPKPLSGAVDGSGSAAADLVAMDAAVVTVLLAEWALFTLLLKLEIVPDVLVGCSTGEFAALTMGGAANILTSAPMFYRLSTDVANSLPKERLAQLRSIKVKSSLDSFADHLHPFSKDVFLSADLSNEQVILTGDKSAVARLVSGLEKSGIEVDYLPVAIPYHTALVAGAVTTDHAEVESTELQVPEIPSWSCSIASEYPQDAEAIKHVTTELFSRPIRFKETINKLYETADVTTFLEVGPKDVLTPIVTEILSDKPHVAIASNRAVGSAVSHLNHALAQLYCCGVPMNFEYLYARRLPKVIELRADPEEVALVVPVESQPVYMDSSLPATFELPVIEQDEVCAFTETRLMAPDSMAHGVVEAFLAESAEVHQSLMRAQQEIMKAYLAYTSNDFSGGVPSSSLEEEDLARYFPLLNGCSVTQQGSSCFIDLPLNLHWHQYLLDHAIGGAVRTTNSSERVCLLPLTVALELMAEAAICLYPEFKVIELQEIRAFKRIRVGSDGFAIRISATPRLGEVPIVDVALHRGYAAGDVESENTIVEAETLMSCRVLLGSFEETHVPNIALPKTEWDKSKFFKQPLYGKGAMFHGPSMQSVTSIEGVSATRIYGLLDVRNPIDWFPADAGYAKFVLDPLLLDNSTQLVLYYLFEHNQPVDALLPFMIDSLKVTRQGIPSEDRITVWAEMNSVTARGTDADVYLLANDGQLIAKFESIKSRRIVLAEHWRKFVYDPAENYLSRPAASIAGSFLDTKDRIYRFIDDSLLPEDEATLNWCADYVLGPRESKLFETLTNSRRKREWLLGRIAAKDAVRLLLRSGSTSSCACADIEIVNDASGVPSVHYSGDRFSLKDVCISITHKDGFAVAVAAKNDYEQKVGIDIERIESREVGLETLLFTEAERSILGDWLGHNRDLALAAAWSAKEAVAKAFGTGLMANPKTFEIQTFEGPADKNGSLLHWTFSPTLIEAQMHNGAVNSKMPDPINVSAEVTSAFVLSECILAP